MVKTRYFVAKIFEREYQLSDEPNKPWRMIIGVPCPASRKNKFMVARYYCIVYSRFMEIQGVKVADVCARFGTPLYIYDAEKIITQVVNLKKAFEQTDLKIKYASKALTNISIIKLLQKNG